MGSHPAGSAEKGEGEGMSQGILFGGKTLERAKQELRERLDGGTTCPCCGQFAKRYKRKIHSGMVRSLVFAYRSQGKDGWIHGSQMGAWGGDCAKLRYWGLLEERGDEGDQTPSSGWWRITPLGEMFVTNQTRVPKYVYLYNAEVEGFSLEEISVVEAVGDKFDFWELMRESDVSVT